MVWIYRDSLQKQTHCQNTEFFPLCCCYCQVKYLLFFCQPKESPFLLNCNAVTLKCEKGIKTCHDKIFLLQSIPPLLLCLYHLPTPFWLAMTGLFVKATALHSQWQEKLCVCMVVCCLTDQWFCMKKNKVAAPAVSCAVLKPCHNKFRLLTSECVCSSTTVQVRQSGFVRISKGTPKECVHV